MRAAASRTASGCPQVARTEPHAGERRRDDAGHGLRYHELVTWLLLALYYEELDTCRELLAMN